jgi:hypothetical protein
VSAKTIASGFYATCSVSSATTVWLTVGTDLGIDARTFVKGGAAWDTASQSKELCQRRCDNSNNCWGFFFNATSKECLYRGGVGALATRSFFVMPTTPTPGAGLQASASQQCVVPDQVRSGHVVQLVVTMWRLLGAVNCSPIYWSCTECCHGQGGLETLQRRAQFINWQTFL